jgi:hypothetical protein
MKKIILLLSIVLGLQQKSFSQFETDMNGSPSFLGIQLNSNKKDFTKSLLLKGFKKIDTTSYIGLGYTILLVPSGYIFVLDNTKTSSIHDALSNYENCYKIMNSIYKIPWQNTEITYTKTGDFLSQKLMNFESGKYDISKISTIWMCDIEKKVYLFLNLQEISGEYNIIINYLIHR